MMMIMIFPEEKQKKHQLPNNEISILGQSNVLIVRTFKNTCCITCFKAFQFDFAFTSRNNFKKKL